MNDEAAAANLRPAMSGAARAFAWVSVALAVATFGWLARGLGRGLELTDESYYVLSAIHSERIRVFFTPTHWVSGVLWQTSQSLTGFRAIGLLASVAAAILLGWGALRLAPRAGIAVLNSRAAQAAALASACSGAMLYGSLLNFTPSYNLLAACGACAAVGLGLLSIAAAREMHSRLLATLAGLALGVTVLCKFPSGICAGALVVLLQATFDGRKPSRRVGIALLVGAAATVVAVAILLETGYAEALRQFRAGVTLVWSAQGDSTTVGRLIRSASDVAGMLVSTVRDFWGPLACFALALRWRPQLLRGIGCLWFAALLASGKHFSAGMSHYLVQAVPIAATLMLCLLATTKDWTAGFRAVALTFVLTALPFAVALGTWNPLQIQILTALAPWGAVIGLFAFACRDGKWPVAVTGVAFGTLVLMQVISNGADPFRMRPLTEQTQPVSLPQLGTVKVDAATAALVRDMQSAARQCGITPGAPFLDFYNLPGVALMLGAVPIDTPWLLDPRYAGLALQRADPQQLRQAVIAVKLDPGGARPAPPVQLQAFPAGYRLCGRGRVPFDGAAVELWSPNGSRPG